MNYESSQHNLAWFKDCYSAGTLTIKPPYQRKPVWAARQKCYLIESILSELPVPEIYIQQTTTEEGVTRYAIVDGQQRIRTVLQFIGLDADPGEQEANKFVLDKLPSTSEWKNLAFADLTSADKKRFYAYKFAVRYLNTENDEDVRDMFRRLNKFLSPLKAQELRNATYAGPFVDLSLKLANDEFWVRNGIVTTASIRRMGDVEFMSELLIGVMHGPQGGSARTVDEYYEQYEDFEEEFPEQRKVEKLFTETLSLVRESMPGLDETRWSNKTDFYTLFVTLAAFLRHGSMPLPKRPELWSKLQKFGRDITSHLIEKEGRTTKAVAKYVAAVEKGANEKTRRAYRQEALTEELSSLFVTAGAR